MKDIPALRASTLNKLIKRFTASPKLILTKLFGEDKSETEKIEWEAETGSRGLTPFSSEDTPAPQTSPGGISQHEAMAAFWQEKIHMAASFLNNLRQPGSKVALQRAMKYVSTQMMRLRNRCDRRKEWMFGKMIATGAISYLDSKMNKRTVDYGVPAGNIVTLGTDDKWNAASPTILADIMDANITMSNANQASIDHALFTSEVLKLMVTDSGIQTLLKKSAFGQGDLFTNPGPVLGSLLNIQNMILYDDMFQIRTYLTTALASGAGPHTIYVEDTTDFEVGGTLYAKRTAIKQTPESVTITAVSPNDGTITATGTLSYSYKAIEDVVYMAKKFLDPNYFVMFASQVEGQNIAEFLSAPFGNERAWGTKVDTWPKKDPDGTFVRVRSKGLPVLYFEDAIFSYKVT